MGDLLLHRLGRVEYEDWLRIQSSFQEARADGRVGDALFLVEHPPVLTLGRGGKRAHVLASPAVLAARRVQVFETDRGGDVTFHGPGQIVGYPILQLEGSRRDVRRYVRDLEEVVIRVLASRGIVGRREARWPGVWVGEGEKVRKVAAVGVHLSRWVTSHGFALNVSTDLSWFDLIIPCGIRGAGVSSVSAELGVRVDPRDLEAAVAERFAEVFGGRLVPAEPAVKTVSVTVVRRAAFGAEVLLLRRTPERGAFWQTVTGHVEPGEPPDVAAAREVAEETGLELTLAQLDYRHSFLLGAGEVPRLGEETAFGGEWTGPGEVRLSAEHAEFRWVRWPEAAELLPFAGLREGARRAVERLTA